MELIMYKKNLARIYSGAYGTGGRNKMASVKKRRDGRNITGVKREHETVWKE